MRLLLVRHPGTAATRRAAVPRDEPATAPLHDLTGWLGQRGTVLTSPARRCHVPGATVEPLLRPWDLGRWAGLPLAEVIDAPAWRADPAYDGHGGESLLALLARVRLLLRQWDEVSGRLAAVTHSAVIRAVLVEILHAPPEAFWDIDVMPGAHSELHRRRARWRVTSINVTQI